LGVLKAVKDVFPHLTLPASALDEFGEMTEKMGRNPDGRTSMTAHDDGYVIHESTAEEVDEHVFSLKQTRNRISGTCRVVGIAVSADLRLRQIATETCNEQAFDLDALLGVGTRARLVSKPMQLSS